MNLDSRLLAQLRSVRLLFGLTIFFGASVGGLIIAQAATLSNLIARVFVEHVPLAQLWNPLLVLLAVMTVRALCAWASEASAAHMAARLKADLRARAFATLLERGPLFARGERTGELAHTLSEGVEALDAYYSQYLPQLVFAAFIPLAMLAWVLPLDWISGVILLVTGPLVPLFMILIGGAAEALTRKQYRELSWLSAHFLDVMQGLTTLKMFGRSRAEIATLARLSERYRDTTLGVLRVAFLSAFALEMIATLSTAMIAVQVGLRLLAGQMQFEQALFVLVLAPDFYLPLRLLGTRFHAGMSGVAAAARLFEILDAPPQPTLPLAATRPASANAMLAFAHVSFGYAGGQPALDNVSFEIARGQHVALVGASGAGKSTVANLLLRFGAPTRGEIFLAGSSSRAVAPDAWRAQMGWVPQLPYLFNTSVADNIRLARPAATTEEVVRAAQLAHADEFVRALPHGYATRIGERGARLSGGQAQRLALARAFLQDAPCLILDEPTSQLDVENEALIQDALANLMRGRTVLTITHRLATAARADAIIVLERGRVVETGTHRELMARRGAYYRLASAGRFTLDEEEARPVRLADADWSGSEKRKPEVENRTLSVGVRAPLFQLLAFVAPFKRAVALAVLLGALTIGSSIALMATSAYIIAFAALQPSIADLAVPIVGVRFFGIARGGLRYLERYVSHYVNFSVLARLRVWLYAALEPRAPANLLAERSGDLLTRAVGDVETLQNFFVRVLAPTWVALIVAIGAGVFLSMFSPMLALVVLAFMALVGVVVPVSVRRLSHAANESLSAARADLNAELVDGVQGMADLIAFGRATAQRARVETLSAAWTRAQTQMALLASAHSALGNWLAQAAMWCALVVAIPLVTSAHLEGVYLPVVALAVLASFEGVLALPLAFQYLDANERAARRLFEWADASGASERETRVRVAPTESVDAVVPANVPLLAVRDLSFRYAPDAPLVLDGVSFDLFAGKTLALVGASGAGKSTLVNVLMRFWDQPAGAIEIGGRDVRALTPDHVRAWFAVAAQAAHLFNATIRENIALAFPDATDAEIIRAAQLAHIHDFVTQLPAGYATRIGEQGLRLSGGERQRLALARALVKPAPLLILDEPTAHLDPRTERQVLRAIWAERRATLLITHRLVELEEVDEILVLRAGRIVERGRHADLVRAEGWYWRMWQAHTAVCV